LRCVNGLCDSGLSTTLTAGRRRLTASADCCVCGS